MQKISWSLVSINKFLFELIIIWAVAFTSIMCRQCKFELNALKMFINDSSGGCRNHFIELYKYIYPH